MCDRIGVLEALGQVFEVLSCSVVLLMGFERGRLVVFRVCWGEGGVT